MRLSANYWLNLRKIPILVAVFLLLLSGCKTAPQIKPPEEKPQPTPARTQAAPTAQPTLTPTVIAGTISIWHTWDESDLPALAIIIKGFQQEYPDVYFDVTYINEQDLLARFMDEANAGHGPHIFLGPADWGNDLAQTGLTLDLSELAKDALLAKLNRAALEGSRKKDVLISLPYRLEGVVLYRNKDIETLTADSMQGLASLAQTSTQGNIIGAYLERSFFFSAGHLEGLGGRLMDAQGHPTFNTAEGQAWIDLLKFFESAGPTSFQTDDDLIAFKEGKVGWIIDGTWNLSGLIEAIGPDKLAIDPWPTFGPGRMAGFVQSQNVYLRAGLNAQQKNTAWKFIEFLLSPAAQAHLGDIGYIPSASGVNLTNPVNGSIIMQALIALANGVPYPQTPTLPIYETQLNLALQSIFQGSSPAAALQIAQENIMTEISKSGMAVTPVP